MSKDALNYIKGLPIPKLIMLVGILGMAVSGISDGIFGYQIVEGMNAYIFGGCLLLLIVGYLGWLVTKQQSLKIRELDAAVRKERIEAGMEDKTVYRDEP